MVPILEKKRQLVFHEIVISNVEAKIESIKWEDSTVIRGSKE